MKLSDEYISYYTAVSTTLRIGLDDIVAQFPIKLKS